MTDSKKIVGGTFILFSGFFVIAQNMSETISLIAGLAISALGVWIILSGID
tara:strand:- start:2000 stop:2152 length:153 start_codon:yes stop_codon:yes gene_type:complete